jgi:hypothetical protein
VRALQVLLVGLYLTSAALIAVTYRTPITAVWPLVVVFVTVVVAVVAAGFGHSKSKVEGTHGSLSWRDLLATCPIWASGAMFVGFAVTITYGFLGSKEFGSDGISLTTFPSLARSWLGLCLGAAGWGVAMTSSELRARGV